MTEITIADFGFLPEDFTGRAIYPTRITYYVMGSFHREDGPAIIYTRSGKKSYYLYNAIHTKTAWFEKLTEEQKVIAMMNPENFK